MELLPFAVSSLSDMESAVKALLAAETTTSIDGYAWNEI